jgi:hypothetical protein
VAILVPFALLVAGYRRAFTVWIAGAIAITLLAIASLGPDGVHTYIDRLHAAANARPDFFVPTTLTLPGLLGRGWVALIAQAAIVALTLLAAYRRRHDGPELSIVAGIIGSLLVTPYIHFEDVTAVVVAAWLYLRTAPPRYGRILLAAGYVVLLPTVVYQWGLAGLEPVFVCFEVAWLGLITWPLGPPATQKRVEPGPAAMAA